MIIIQIILFAAIAGCNSSDSTYLDKQDDNFGELRVNNDTISFSKLSISAGDSIVQNYYLLNGKRYSGCAIKYEMAEDGRWSFVYTFKKGIWQRFDVYGLNGYQHRFVELKNGYDYHMVMFHRNGNKYLEEYYDKDKKPIGKWKSWHESGEIDWEKNYN